MKRSAERMTNGRTRQSDQENWQRRRSSVGGYHRKK
jgi:hypothetical protein